MQKNASTVVGNMMKSLKFKPSLLLARKGAAITTAPRAMDYSCLCLLQTAKSALQLSVHDFQQGVQAVLKGNRHKPMRCTYPARTLAALIAVTAIYIVPFIIDEQLKMFYYRGLSEWPRERGYLVNTCLTAQDIFKKNLDYFKIPY